MSDLIRLATPRKTSRGALFEAWLAGGTLVLYDGTVPADADEAIGSQTVLATFTLPDPAGDTEDGVFTLANGSEPVLIATDGTPDFARALDSTSGVVGDFDVGLTGSGAAVEVDNLNLVEGAMVSLLGLTITEG